MAQEIRCILKDKQAYDQEAFKHELIDIFVCLIQASMALKTDLEKEYYIHSK